jgi:hypothetical protein
VVKVKRKGGLERAEEFEKVKKRQKATKKV